MKQQCLACGIEKDTSIKEVYPYPDDGIDDELVAPLFSFDCQGVQGAHGVEDWRVVTICHSCFHKLNPDMWINEPMWQSLNPIMPFESLPKLP